MTRVGNVCLSLTDPYYLGIGAVMHRWATLEYLLQNIIWRAMGLDNKQGRVLTIGMGAEVLSGILRNLPRRWINDEGTKSQLAALLSDVKDLTENRNHIAHGIWTVYEDDREQTPCLNYMKKGSERILPGAEPVSPATLHAFANAIDGLNQRALQVLDCVGGVQTPSLDKSE